MLDWKIILINLYYIGVAVAFLVKDILALRVIMILAGISMIIHGVLVDNNIVIFWISLFTFINTVQVIRIIYENRGIKLIKDLEELYNLIFRDMSRKEFQRLWIQGELITVAENEFIVKDGENPEKVFLIINGTASVKKSEGNLALLRRGNFIAEMSYLTGKETSADVISDSALTCICWSHKKLNRLKEINQLVYNKFHLIISKDLSNKLKKVSGIITS
jgi:Popeye-like protein